MQFGFQPGAPDRPGSDPPHEFEDVAAQINGLIAYLSYYGIATPLMRPAAIGNGWILLQLALYSQREAEDPVQPDSTAFSPTKFVIGLVVLWFICFVGDLTGA